MFTLNSCIFLYQLSSKICDHKENKNGSYRLNLRQTHKVLVFYVQTARLQMNFSLDLRKVVAWECAWQLSNIVNKDNYLKRECSLIDVKPTTVDFFRRATRQNNVIYTIMTLSFVVVMLFILCLCFCILCISLILLFSSLTANCWLTNIIVPW